MLSLRCLDPEADAGAVDAVVRALHPLLVPAWPQDQPWEPPPTLRSLLVEARRSLQDDPVRLVVAAEDGPVGVAQVVLPERDNAHVALVAPWVAPSARRAGVGRALWTAVQRTARQQGRTRLLVEALEGSPLDGFLGSVGARPELTEVLRQQRIAELDLGQVRLLRAQAQERAAGYRIVPWAGPTPASLLALSAEATEVLNDAPTGGLDYDDERWDADRVAARDALMTASGRRLHAALALAPDGSVAGSTEVWVEQDGRTAWQWGTSVAAAHRGHRLGMLLKTTLVERLRALEPALEVVSTGNADTTAHMIAVNDALGHRPVARVREWQCEVEPAAAPGGRAGTRPGQSATT